MILTQGIHYTVDGSGHYTFVPSYSGTVQITYQQSVAASVTDPLTQLGLSFQSGYSRQPVWGYLTTNYPSQALAYSGLAYLYAPSYDLGSTAEVVNHSFEVSTSFEQTFTVDADPGAVINDMLTNQRYGANFPPSRVGSFTALTLYARAQGLQMSPAMVNQKSAGDWLTYLLAMCNSDVTWSQGILKFVPLGDTAVTGNGVTYTPNITPQYDLTEDDFIVEGTEDGVEVARKSNEEAFNHVRVEYFNRANQYNVEIVESKDAADIDQRGIRTMPTVEAHALCESSAAVALATLIRQRQMSVRNEYKFTLSWKFGLLEPLDLVTITYSPKSLLRVPVRINRIDEREDGNFDFEAEDAPIGMAGAPAYGAPSGSGFAHNYNVSPGAITTPTIFEASVELTTNGLEVWAAVNSADPNWGGCSVWVALDGSTDYKLITRMPGGARYGYITSNLTSSGTAVGVQLVGTGGTLLPGTALDAATLNTLCYIFGSVDGGEYVSYQGSTMTAANAFNLTGLVRGAFDTTEQVHSVSHQFVRIDEAVARSGPIDLSYIGKTISFKFTSFNIFGGAEETLSEVVAYPYTITGSMAELPPANFDEFLLTIQPDGTRQFTFAYNGTPRPVDFLGAQIRYVPGIVASPAFDTMQRLDNLPDNGFYSQSPVETNALLSGDYTFALVAIDTTRNQSKLPLYIQATLPNRRLGDIFDEFIEDPLWLGTLTNCHNAGGILEANDSVTWATAPATWGAFARWNTSPSSPIQYETPVRDFGTVLAGRVNSTVDADGTVLQELATSTDGVSWSGWSAASDPFNTQYLKLRLTVTATVPEPIPVVRSWDYQIASPLKSEYINNAVISGYTGAYRIGTGDIRIPVINVYSLIKRVSVIIQDSSIGAWTYQRIDNNVSPGPRFQFKLNGLLTDPAFVDFFVEGY